MATQADVTSDILNLLSLSAPELDTTIGSVTRKIVDAVSATISNTSMDQFLLGYQYDVDSKSGADLDEFVRIFGFTRFPAQQSGGEVTFSRTTPATSPIVVPANSQVSTSDGGVIVVTIVSTVLPIGATTVATPAQALVGGTSGNLAAGTLTQLVRAVDGITAVSNVTSFFGGTDLESDASLRARFKLTIFRNMAGTEGMFIGTALNDRDVEGASVVGASRHYKEVIQFTTGVSVITSTLPDGVYVLPNSVVAGMSVQYGDILTRDVDYSFDPTVVPPTITRLSTVNIPDNSLLQVEYDYLPICSRNSYAAGITNRVDLFCAGSRATPATETLTFKVARQFTATSTSPYYLSNYQRLDESQPVAGNFFIPYGFVPVIDGGGTTGDTGQITIGGNTYVENTGWWLVKDVSNVGGSNTSYAGIEVKSSANGGPTNPADGTSFPIYYTYDGVPSSVASALTNWKLVGWDVMVHEAIYMLLNINLVVLVSQGYSTAQAQSDLNTALSNFLSINPMGTPVQASDILQVAHAPSSIDAVRFATDVDNSTNYAIQRVNALGTIMQTFSSGTTPKRAIDIFLSARTVANLNQVNITVRAANNFGSS